MPLICPNVFSLRALNGGYNSTTDFNYLKDNQTNDARNIDLTKTSIKKSNGYVKLLGSALLDTTVKTSATVTDIGNPITGHYQIIKSGREREISSHIVANGPSLWNYNTSTASLIMTGLTNEPNAFWRFVQIMDPRSSASAADDIIIGVNGYDPPIIWNGIDASADHLSSIAESSGVRIAKFIASVKGRIAMANITDYTDVDSTSKLILSDFNSSTTLPTPHQFPIEIVVGGSDKYGPIAGIVPLNENIVIFKRNATYMFNLGGGSTIDPSTQQVIHDFSLQQVNENIGCIAPNSIVSVGNAIFFLAEGGVYAFDGQTFTYVGEPIEEDLKDVNFFRRKYAQAIYDRGKNQFKLAMASSGKNYNDMLFTYDLTLNRWHPPRTDMRVNILSTFKDSEQDKVLCGDHIGFLYELDKGDANGCEIGYNDLIPETYPAGGIAFADGVIPGNMDRLAGASLSVLEGPGKGLKTSINIHNCQTVYISDEWSAALTTESKLSIGGIDGYFNTKHFDFGDTNIDKLYARTLVQAKQLGDFNFKMNYVIDFNEISNAGSATIDQCNTNFIRFDVSATGDGAIYCGTIETAANSQSEINVSAGTDLSASNIVTGAVIQLWNSGTRYLRVLASGECETLKLAEYGGLSNTMSAIDVNTGTTYQINTNTDGTWGSGKFGQAKTKINKLSLRNIKTQPLIGKYLSLRFINERANEPFEIYGFDQYVKAVGRR